MWFGSDATRRSGVRRLMAVCAGATSFRRRSARSTFSVLAPCMCPCSLTTASPLSEILPTLRSIKSTARMIDTRLLCATNNPNEVASPAFGTF